MTFHGVVRVGYFAIGLMCGTWELGCAASGDDGERGAVPGDESLGETHSELSTGRWFWSWGTTDGGDLDMGPSTDRTCFLAGVAGNLNAGAPNAQGGRESIVQVRESDGRWILTARGGWAAHNAVIGNPVNAHAVCIGIKAATIGTFIGGPGNPVNQKALVAAATANRQCFLSDVRGYNAAWQSSNASVKVYQQNGNWYLEAANIGTSVDSPLFAATCFDIPAGTWAGTGAWGVGNPGSATVSIGTEGGPMLCGLTGIQGPLNANDWNDGALINWPASFPGTWTMSLKNGKAGFVTCID